MAVVRFCVQIRSDSGLGSLDSGSVLGLGYSLVVLFHFDSYLSRGVA